MERWFALIRQRAIKRGSSDSIPRPVRTIKGFIDDYNETAAPFVWVATADSILKKIEKLSTPFAGQNTSGVPMKPGLPARTGSPGNSAIAENKPPSRRIVCTIRRRKQTRRVTAWLEMCQ